MKAAQFLAAAHSRHALSTAFPIREIQEADEERGKGEISVSYMTYVFVGVVLLIICGMLVGVLIGSQKKRARGITWFPEGFLRNNSGQRRRSRRRGPDGQEMR